MILSGDDIHKALAEGRMIVEPAPGREQIDTTSIDLHMGEPLWIWDPALNSQEGDALKVNLDEYNYREFSKRHQVAVEKETSGRFLLQPKHRL